MSFSVPRNVPSFTNPARNVDDHPWAPAGMAARAARDAGSGGLLHGVHTRMEGLFDAKPALPMYKDKPYSYAASRRIRPAWRRKRVLGFLGGVVVLVMMWLNGVFEPERNGARPSVWSFKSLTETYGRPDWEARRNHVVRAFEESWEAYEKYAWGELTSRLGQRRCFFRVTNAA